MALLTARFIQTDSQIASVQEAIANLQAQLSDLQAYRQQLLSVEQACESALSQIDTALMMLNHVDPAEIATLKAAVEAKFGTEAIAQLPSTPDTEPTAPPQPEPEPTPNNDNGAIEVEAIADGPTNDVESDAPSSTTNLTLEDLKALPFATLRKAAKAKGLPTVGKRYEIAYRLRGIVSAADISGLA